LNFAKIISVLERIHAYQGREQVNSIVK